MLFEVQGSTHQSCDSLRVPLVSIPGLCDHLLLEFVKDVIIAPRVFRLLCGAFQLIVEHLPAHLDTQLRQFVLGPISKKHIHKGLVGSGEREKLNAIITILSIKELIKNCSLEIKL